MAKKSQGKSVYFFTLEKKIFEHFLIFFRAFRTKSGQIRTCPDLNTNEKIENSKTKVFLKFRKLKSNPGKIFTDLAESASIAQEMEKTEILGFFYVKKTQTEMDGTSDFK